MKAALILLLLTLSMAVASDDRAGWSQPVKVLRARLSVLPSQKADSPFCRVFMEFENVEDVLGQKKIRFNPGKLSLRVRDKDGNELTPANGPYDGMSPLWDPIALPYAGSVRFQISFPGLGYHPATDKVIVDVGVGRSWVIPQDGSAYYLSGSLSIKREETDHPYIDWSGTLELPNVEIPKGVTLGASSHALAAPVSDLIEVLANQLNSDPMWPNGEAPIISLSSNAAPREVVAGAVKMWGFDSGHIKTFEIVEVREIPLDAKPGCSAALIQSDLGTKILLFRYEPHDKMSFWWTRFYNAPKETEPSSLSKVIKE